MQARSQSGDIALGRHVVAYIYSASGGVGCDAIVDYTVPIVNVFMLYVPWYGYHGGVLCIPYSMPLTGLLTGQHLDALPDIRINDTCIIRAQTSTGPLNSRHIRGICVQ